MGIDLTGTVISIIGGDRRDLVLMKDLVRLGARVKAAGFAACEDLQQVELVADLEAAVTGAQVLILPMNGTDPEGKIPALDSSVSLQLTQPIANIIPQRHHLHHRRRQGVFTPLGYQLWLETAGDRRDG